VNNTRTCSRSLDISCGTNPNLTNPNYIAQLYLWIIRGLLRGRYTHAKHIYSHARARYWFSNAVWSELFHVRHATPAIFIHCHFLNITSTAMWIELRGKLKRENELRRRSTSQ